MERLTARNDDGRPYYPKCFEAPCKGWESREECAKCQQGDDICERLAAYEDLELLPEQLRELDGMYREVCEKLAEYQKLEEQGLLLRLPYKDVYTSSGDIVYYIFDYEIVECINCGISIDCDGKTWIALACDEHIFPYREPIAEIDADPTDWCLNSTAVSVDEWGKTVFLSETEAQEALERMVQNG